VSAAQIWLLSAYHADSHAAWSDWLIHQLPFEWQLFSLPGRHFRWRIRGNPIAWLDLLPETPPDAIVATSMVDLAVLRGLRRDLCTTPALLYFHENQFAYPVSPAQHASIDPQMVQLFSALSADRILFNSGWNRDSFFNGVTALCRRLPDHCPGNLAARLLARSQLLPVAVTPVASGQKDGGLILWNHRWEYDKAPEVFAEAIELLSAFKVPFQLALLGRRSGKTSPALERIRSAAADRILVDAEVSRSQYREWLGRADIVISTAKHEFQGLAVLEAVSAGATPLVPDALCYVEQYPQAYRYPPGDAHLLAVRLRQWLLQPPPPPDVSGFLEQNLRQPWWDEVQRLLHSSL